MDGPFVSGHEHEVTDRAVKGSFLANSRRSLNDCAVKLEARGTLKDAALHRRALLDGLRKDAPADDLARREAGAVPNTTHHFDATDITPYPDISTLFTNQTCILSTEGEIGPFWVKGEYNRQDIVDDEPGVVNYMHTQFVDVNTCEPMPELCNGNGDDASNLDNMALCGLQKTDENGIASFRSIFPGHYSGRATHVHVLGAVNASLLRNGTITGGSVSHIGQLFFEQDLITEVKSTYPYSTSTVEITPNSADHVFTVETEESNSDPIFNYVYLNESGGAEGGLFSWITIGVDPTASYDASYAALLTVDGGVKNEASSGGPTGGDTPSGSIIGAAPTGTAPSGPPTSTTASM
ncbi:hypothetical protein E8E13_000586 [Curvularia kusanoi]|uniref:Intradiol ring-cleavage dioxygenases domain-containing protein n=1 Tax=Curvularia kusanoi TaxID=90978 RepID=A0A9P4THG1_CURKU|nr:hypothetical protein E8E13_000586 [Curvularia kusanoi]